jgi:hypothetical protein
MSSPVGAMLSVRQPIELPTILAFLSEKCKGLSILVDQKAGQFPGLPDGVVSSPARNCRILS